MKKLTLSILILVSFFASADLRKDNESHKVAKLALRHIVTEAKKLPSGARDKATDELKEICSKVLHKGCYFWKRSSSINFQPLDNKGNKDGKIYELESWLKKIFK